MKKIIVAMFSLLLVVAVSTENFAQAQEKEQTKKTVKAPTEPSNAAKTWKTLSKITFKKEYDEIMARKEELKF